MKEMIFYRSECGCTYSKINGKIFNFDKNKFTDNINEKVFQYGESLLKQFLVCVELAKAGDDMSFTEKEIEEAKITFMKEYFYLNGFGK